MEFWRDTAIRVDPGPQPRTGRARTLGGHGLFLSLEDSVQHRKVKIDLRQHRSFAPTSGHAVWTLLIGPVVYQVAPFARPLWPLATVIAVLYIPSAKPGHRLFYPVARSERLVSWILLV